MEAGREVIRGRGRRMTDATLSYARSIRRLAEVQARQGGDVVLTLNPPSALYLAHMLERGAGRGAYVTKVQAEAEMMRDIAETRLLEAGDACAAADRALKRARVVERTSQIVAVWLALVVLWVVGVAL